MAEQKSRDKVRRKTPDTRPGHDARQEVPPQPREGPPLTEQERADAAGGEPARSRFGKTPRWGSVPVLVIVVAAAVVVAIVILMLIFGQQSPVVP
jgi:hypothetical protein